MNKWLWIPILLTVFFIGDRVGGKILASLTERSDFRYSRLYTGRAKADIVLLGNSRGLNFYQPIIEEKTGKSTLNLSYNGLPAQLGAVLLNDYLERYGAPEHLVMDVTFLDRDNDELVEDFRLYMPYSEGIDSLLKLVDRNIYYGTYVANLARYGGEVAQRMLYYLGRSDEDWLLDRVIGPQAVADAQALAPYRNEVETYRIEQINSAVQKYRQAGTKVHLVINPYYPAFAKTITNLDSLSTEVELITSLPVRNYAMAVEGDDNFGDYQHLNKKGAIIYLERMLVDIGLLGVGQ